MFQDGATLFFALAFFRRIFRIMSTTAHIEDLLKSMNLHYDWLAPGHLRIKRFWGGVDILLSKSGAVIVREFDFVSDSLGRLLQFVSLLIIGFVFGSNLENGFTSTSDFLKSILLLLLALGTASAFLFKSNLVRILRAAISRSGLRVEY